MDMKPDHWSDEDGWLSSCLRSRCAGQLMGADSEHVCTNSTRVVPKWAYGIRGPITRRGALQSSFRHVRSAFRPATRGRTSSCPLLAHLACAPAISGVAAVWVLLWTGATGRQCMTSGCKLREPSLVFTSL